MSGNVDVLRNLRTYTELVAEIERLKADNTRLTTQRDMLLKMIEGLKAENKRLEILCALRRM